MGQKILSHEALSIFCGSMAAMLRSGFTPDRAAAIFAEDASGAAEQAAPAMHDAMNLGSTFADAAEETGVFPEYALGVFRTAELSGRLDEALDRLADYYQRQHNLMIRLQNTLTYPVALLLMMCMVLAVLVFQVLPMFERVYESLTGSLAASSYAYVLGAAAISRVGLAVACCAGILLLVLAVALRFPGAREALRGPMERSVLTRKASWLLAESALLDTMSTLLSSGMEPEGAMELSLRLTQHRKLKAALEGCMENVRQGQDLAQTLCGPVLTGLSGRMLLSGSQSGNLGKTMAELSARLGAEADEALEKLIDGVEPVLIGFLTICVGLTLVSVMLPLLGILGAV